MEKNLSTHRYHDVSSTPSVLLAGFPIDEANGIIEALEKMGWTAISLNKKTKVEVSFARRRFNITAIDTEHLEAFGPDWIARLRAKQGPSARATILAINDSGSEEIKQQLTQAGADLVVKRQPNPKMYVIDFAQAATLRLKKIGQKHA